MKIQGASGPMATPASARTQGQAAPGFTPTAPGLSNVAPANLGGVMGAPSLDALLALQEMLGPIEKRRRAVKRAGRLLDILDALKLSLLEGGGADDALATLKGAVDEQRGETDDPRLEGVLDEIEIRAAVELAKQEFAATRPGASSNVYAA